ncbi:MAG: amidohydrolase [Candidatus Auribacterota bacterium]|nr:amidohydrolase [Candidatus Auribacterota bacterium]
MKDSFIVTGDYVITVDPERRIIREGAVVVENGVIRAVGKKSELLKDMPGLEVIGGQGRIVLPGLINCHIHLPQFLMRGVNDDVDCLTILKDYIWPIQGIYDQEDAAVSSRLGFLEMIRAGTTCFLSTGFHPRYGMDNICRELEESGLRGVVSKYVMEVVRYSDDSVAIHPGLREDGETSLRQAEELIEKWDGKAGGRIRVWISPRSVGAYSPEYLRRVSRLAEEYGVGMHAHWSEVPENVSYIRDTYHMTPSEFARDTGLLTPKTVLVHGIFFEESEFELLREGGASICHCPVCNSKLAMGIAPVSRMLENGVNVCLGNDGMLDDNTADLFREMRSFCILQRILTGDPTFPTAATALELATINGARALGMENEIGSLEVGKQADLIVVNSLRPHFTPVLDPLSAIVWSATGSDVETTIVDGNILMRDDRVITMYESEVLHRAEVRSRTVMEKSGVSARHNWSIE